MRRSLAAALAALPLVACEGPQSALSPAGTNAREVMDLWWLTIWVSIGVTLLVTATMLHGLFAKTWRGGTVWRKLLVAGGGVALPAIVLPVLLVSSLRIEWPYAHPRPDDYVIDVVAWQFWWEVRYPHPEGGPPVIAANEVRIPVGVPVRFRLATQDVIHSFWIPKLAGKVDMIPGRTNSARVLAEAPGSFRGACFEFCGLQHANMAFTVEAVPPGEFEAWLRREAAPAAAPATPEAEHGQALFLRHGCGSCHAVRGHGAEGRVAPDLTHLASRPTIGAGMLPNNRGSLSGWIAATQQIKPGANMPSFNQLSGPDLHALVSYLEGLR